MNITAHTRYAIQAMIEIAQSDQPLAMNSIANQGKIPPAMLEKLLVKYRDAGFIVSTRGVRGGHILAIPAQQISVNDIIAVVEDLDTTKCSGAANCQDGTQCNLHFLWQGLNQRIVNYFDSITLDQLIQPVQLTQQDSATDALLTVNVI